MMCWLEQSRLQPLWKIHGRLAAALGLSGKHEMKKRGRNTTPLAIHSMQQEKDE